MKLKKIIFIRNNLYLCRLLLLMTSCLLLVCLLSPNMIDSVVLKEQRYPNYYNYLSRNQSKIYYLNDGVIRTSDNVLNLNPNNYRYGSLNIKIDEYGVITIDGKNDSGRDWFLISRGQFFPNSVYLLFDGNKSNEEVYLYTTKWYWDSNSLKSCIDAHLPYENVIEMDNDGLEYYDFAIYVKPEAIVNNLKLYPSMVEQANYEEIKFYNDSLTKSDYASSRSLVFEIPVFKVEELTTKEKSVFNNEINSYKRNYDHIFLKLINERGYYFREISDGLR